MEKKGFISEFKEFIMRGNVIDLAIGVIIGGAFQKIVTSLVNDIIMPVVTRITGGVNFENWFIALDGNKYRTLKDATDAAAPTLNYGVFITEVIQFIIMAFVIFLLVKFMNRVASLRKVDTEEEPAVTKICPYCKSEIDIEATRCPHCTSILEAEASSEI